MNTFLLPEKDRMLSWRELRNLMTKLPEIEAFEALLRFWSKAPICAYAIDGYTCAEWPTPWELMNENMFCTSSIAYMMASTLLLSGFAKDRLSLAFIKGDDDERLVVIIDESIVMNYSYGEVFQWNEIKDDFQIKALFVYKGDKWVEL